MMTRWTRLQKALAGERPDRVPVAAWRHFPGQEAGVREMVETALTFQDQFDWDLVKVQPSSVHFAEVWGGRYDYQDYQGTSPRLLRPALGALAELGRVRPQAADAGPFGMQLEVMARLAGAWQGEVPFIQTVFSPLSILEYLLGGRQASRAESGVARAIAECPEALQEAAAAVAATLAGYCREVMAAGAWGIFFAITGLCRQGYLTAEEYAKFGRPHDLTVLAAVEGARLNVLHNCGEGIHFRAVADYPVAVLSWATSGKGNPGLAAALAESDRCLMGGVDHTALLVRGSAAEVTESVRAAVAATDGRRLIVAPECSYLPETPVANMQAMRQAVTIR